MARTKVHHIAFDISFQLKALQLLGKDVFQLHGSGCKRTNTVRKLLGRHLILVQLEAEFSWVVNIRLPWDVEAGGLRGVQLGVDAVLAVIEILQKGGLGRNPTSVLLTTYRLPETGLTEIVK